VFRSAYVFACVFALASTAARGQEPFADQLQRIAPRASQAAIETASHALTCARVNNSITQTHLLTLIDYSVASTHPRLWVFDLMANKLLFEELVAHGRNSGANQANRFSNAAGSLMSSIGVYRTADTYIGHNGYSLRLQGLDAGFNDRALDRDIVIHGASYVDETLAQISGRLGRSFGCPAVRRSIARQLIDTIREGSLVVAYYPDQDWLSRSKFLHDCG
jgi:hypothetical protein